MYSITRISGYLKKYPACNSSIGCSTTVTWSGKEGFNTPTRWYEGNITGVIIDPNLVIMPQADLWASDSHSQIAMEINKEGAIEGSSFLSSVPPPLKTKFVNKKGYT